MIFTVEDKEPLYAENPYLGPWRKAVKLKKPGAGSDRRAIAETVGTK